MSYQFQKRWGIALTTLILTAFAATACHKGGDDQKPTETPVAATTTAAITTAPATATQPAPTPTVAPPAKLGTYTTAAITQKDPTFTPLAGATADFGIIGKAAYQIEKPTNWNGSLVLWLDGFDGFGTEVVAEPPPTALREVFISEGFAWAASSFSENGYTPGVQADDTLALTQYFEQKYGKPKKTYLVGESMGGNAIALLLEYYPARYDGALSTCGALWGIDEIDYLLSWGMLAQYFSDVTFPIGQGAEKMNQALLTDLPKVLGTADAPTEKGLQFIDTIRNLSGGSRPFFREGYKDRSIQNLGLLLLDPNRELLVGKAGTNANATYHINASFGLTDAAINAGVQRLAADLSLRNAQAHPDMVPTTGKITKPLLTIHGLGDLFVPVTAEQVYKQRVDAAGAGNLLVQRLVRSSGHCKFSAAEYQQAFNDLVSWVQEGKKPAGDTVTGDLSDAGKTFTNPLRDGDPGNK